MMTYQEQIKHPKWQKKRLEVLKLHKFTCQVCRAKDEELHVHHPYYKRGAMIWEYDKKELECLCHRCHKDAHAIDEKIKKALALCPDKEKVLAFILSLQPDTIVKNEKKPSPYQGMTDLQLWDLKMASDEATEDDGIDPELEPIYAEYPHLRPTLDDTYKVQGEKFFATMKLLMG